MKKIAPLLVLLIGTLLVSPAKPIEEHKPSKTHKLTVLQINAKWNSANAVDIDRLKNCNIEWAFLEDQNQTVRQKFKKIPFIIIKEYDEPLLVREGNIMFEPTVTLEELQTHVNNYK